MITGPLMSGFLSNAHEKVPHIIPFGSIFHRVRSFSFSTFFSSFLFSDGLSHK
jgi:hypothetical protein